MAPKNLGCTNLSGVLHPNAVADLMVARAIGQPMVIESRIRVHVEWHTIGIRDGFFCSGHDRLCFSAARARVQYGARRDGHDRIPGLGAGQLARTYNHIIRVLVIII